MGCIVHAVAKSWKQVSNLHLHWPQREEDFIQLDPAQAGRRRGSETQKTGALPRKLGGRGLEATYAGCHQPSFHTRVYTVSILARQGGLTSQFLTEAPKPREGK